MVDLFAAPDLTQNVVFLRLKFGRNDQPDRFTDSLGRRVAEHLLRSWVPRGYDALEGFADNGIVGRVDDRR